MEMPLTPTDLALLDYLRRDAAAAGGKRFSFDPVWFVEALQMNADEVDAAGRRLAALGLVEIGEVPDFLREYRFAYPMDLLDIRLTEKGAGPVEPQSHSDWA
jgi:hypothetical protein